MMRVMRSGMLALLAMAVVMGTGAPALANTELVPGSRLVFPYIDISGGRETFLMITNSGNFLAAVHLEFYAQNCIRTDRVITLTPKDIAAVQVSLSPGIAAFPAPGASFAQQNFAGIGWADVDVRDPFLGECSSSLLNCPGVEYNGLMGEAIIVDVKGDFLFSYPAAASQGFAASGFTSATTIVGGNTVQVPTGPIVVRDATGKAALWNGAYETYPNTNLIPSFFAEDPCTSNGPARAAFISLVAPADAWRKEAPGQPLGIGTALVQMFNAGAYDGAENSNSINAFAHHVNGRLCTVFPAIAARTFYHNPPLGFYPDVDVTLGATNAVGWLELTNSVLSPYSSATGPDPNSWFSAAAGFDTSIRPRGMVGLLFEIDTVAKTVISGPRAARVRAPVGGAAVRAWADPGSQIDWPCFASETGANAGGIAPPTQLPGLNTPTCDKEPSVPPTWLRDHAQTLFGGGGQ